MKFRDLLTLLEAAHWRRYGSAPDGPWRSWLWEPWVQEFLRAYVPPRARLAVERRTP